MSNPASTIAPITSATRDSVSQGYSGLGDSLRQQFMSTGGGGASGKSGTALLQGDLARRGALANADLTSGTNAVMAQGAGASLASNLLNMDFGGTQTSTGATSSTGSGTGESSGWGVGASAGVGYSPPSGSGGWSFR